MKALHVSNVRRTSRCVLWPRCRRRFIEEKRGVASPHHSVALPRRAQLEKLRVGRTRTGNDGEQPMKIAERREPAPRLPKRNGGIGTADLGRERSLLFGEPIPQQTKRLGERSPILLESRFELVSCYVAHLALLLRGAETPHAMRRTLSVYVAASPESLP